MTTRSARQLADQLPFVGDDLLSQTLLDALAHEDDPAWGPHPDPVQDEDVEMDDPDAGDPQP